MRLVKYLDAITILILPKTHIILIYYCTNLDTRLFKEKSSWRHRFSAASISRYNRVFLRFYNAISSLNTWSTSFDDFC